MSSRKRWDFIRCYTLNPRYNPNAPLMEYISQRIDGFDDEWIPPDTYMPPDPYELEDEALA